MEASTAETLPVMVRVYGRDFAWDPDIGLDPAVTGAVDRFVWGEVKRFSRIGASRGLSFDDLAQEGRVGALIAAQKFNPERGVEFLSYAGWWIRQRILFAINKALDVHMPLRLMLECVKTRTDLPTAISLDMPVGDQKDEPLSAILPGDDSGIEDAASDAWIAERIHRSLAQLQERDREVLELRFGIGCDPQTLEQVGARWGCSRERVRQIEVRAMNRLRQVWGL